MLEFTQLVHDGAAFELVLFGSRAILVPFHEAAYGISFP